MLLSLPRCFACGRMMKAEIFRSWPNGTALVLIAMASIMLAGCAKHPIDVTWNDSRWCVPLRLKIVLNKVSQNFGPVKVYSSHRWLLENKRKGGKAKSYHLTCRAVDFAVGGNPYEVIEFLKSRSEVGGYSHYPAQGFFHIDTGPRRTW